jgi:hypothetical protein
MATLLASKVARVRRHAEAVGFTMHGQSMTDRDFRHLIHACEDSPRRAIRTIKAGEKEVARLIAAWREELTEEHA